MTTNVYVNTYTHSLVYVSDKMLRSVYDIVRLSGLDPSVLVNDWVVVDRGLTTWMHTQHLQAVHLEIYDPTNDRLVTRWDLTVIYNASTNGDGSFQEDPEAIRTAIEKAGHVPARCGYRIIATTRQGRPDVDGWSPTTARPLDGMVRQSVGTAISAPDIQAAAGYWRRV